MWENTNFFHSKRERICGNKKINILEAYSSPLKSSVPVHSFYVTEETEELITIHEKVISKKLIGFKLVETLYLVPLLNIFEHD